MPLAASSSSSSFADGMVVVGDPRCELLPPTTDGVPRRTAPRTPPVRKAGGAHVLEDAGHDNLYISIQHAGALPSATKPPAGGGADSVEAREGWEKAADAYSKGLGTTTYLPAYTMLALCSHRQRSNRPGEEAAPGQQVSITEAIHG